MKAAREHAQRRMRGANPNLVFRRLKSVAAHFGRKPTGNRWQRAKEEQALRNAALLQDGPGRGIAEERQAVKDVSGCNGGLGAEPRRVIDEATLQKIVELADVFARCFREKQAEYIAQGMAKGLSLGGLVDIAGQLVLHELLLPYAVDLNYLRKYLAKAGNSVGGA